MVGGDFRVQNSLTLDSLTEREIKRKHHIITAGGMWQKHTHILMYTHTFRDEKAVVERGLVEGNYTCKQTTVKKMERIGCLVDTDKYTGMYQHNQRHRK